MSEPPNTSKPTSIAIPYSQHYHNRHQHSQQHLPPLIHGGNPTSSTIAATTTTTASTSPHFREYRKGNWTLEETLVLINAKKHDDERRTKPTTSTTNPTTPRATGELRWKWVENFCWSNGCHRSQNQCNDKWDNLLRDYKKVSEYDIKSSQSQSQTESNLLSYWALDKQQRKDQNLPSNLTHQIYEALKDVVPKRCPQKLPATTQLPTLTAIQPPPPLPPPPPSTVAPETVVSDASDSSETDWSGKLDPDTKRRRVRGVGSSIVRGASVLARTMRSGEEKKEKRHREIMKLEERRLRADEAQNQVQQQGIASLVAAVNNLSGAIQSLISERPA